METGSLLTIMLWGLGVCASGFFVLLGMVIKTSKEVAKPLQEIRDALLGTMSPRRPGLFSEFYELRKDIEKFKEQCEKRHNG